MLSQKRKKHEEKFNLKDLPQLLWKSVKMWNSNNPFRLGAVVAYYAVLSLPGLLVIIINSVGAFWGDEMVQGEIMDQFTEAMGPDAANSIIAMVENTENNEESLIATILGIGIMLFGASGVFYQLQISLNEIWNVKQDPNAGFWKVIKDRALSFGFIVVIAFLLLISFVISTGLSLFSQYLSELWMPGIVSIALILEFLFSTAVIALLFVLIFKFMPDVKIKWSACWLGGIITAVLFNIGKYAMSFYFGEADPGSVYGAAGSVVLILLWVSYSSLILYYGASFTRVYAEHYNYEIHPEAHGMIVIEKEIIIEKGSDLDESDNS